MAHFSSFCCVELPATRIVLIVHDEIVLEVPMKDIKRARTLVEEEMIRGGTYFQLKVPLAVTSKIGKTYGTLK